MSDLFRAFVWFGDLTLAGDGGFCGGIWAVNKYRVTLPSMDSLEKPYSLSFSKEDGYLLAEISAEKIDEDIARDYLLELTNKIAESGERRLLLMRNIPNSLGEVSLFNITLDNMEPFRGTRVAVVNPYANVETPISFAMTAGRNRGANCRLFSDAEAAKRWLMS